ncbi:MAG: hypothetical protein KZQ99_04480 [Candidatus Thiodiazotropha sp. (ex Dulcina madagascariensis)]|nr:hypothetical protein [Candidatus Thiodiazotropha sp. (ex Dulcina madagascariensis)]
MKTETQLKQILDEVLSIALVRGNAIAGSDDPYKQGLASGYHDVLEHAKNEAELVGYDLSDLGLDGQRIDALLQPPGQKAG